MITHEKLKKCAKKKIILCACGGWYKIDEAHECPKWYISAAMTFFLICVTIAVVVAAVLT